MMMMMILMISLLLLFNNNNNYYYYDTQSGCRNEASASRVLCDICVQPLLVIVFTPF